MSLYLKIDLQQGILLKNLKEFYFNIILTASVVVIRSQKADRTGTL